MTEVERGARDSGALYEAAMTAPDAGWWVQNIPHRFSTDGLSARDKELLEFGAGWGEQRTVERIVAWLRRGNLNLYSSGLSGTEIAVLTTVVAELARAIERGEWREVEP